jgi:dolichol-phosphate mannosyltransferase
MKCYRREVFQEIRLYGELHRFVPVLAAARGFRVGEIPVTHRPRKFGRSKYGFSRIIKGFLDLLTVKFLTGYGQRPQHLLGAIGLVSFALGGLGLVGLAVWWIVLRMGYGFVPVPLHDRPAMFYSLFYSLGLMLLGGQLMSIGFLAELLIAYHVPESRSYSICERTPPQQ